MSNISDALDYLRPIAASATVGKYPLHLGTVIAAVERLQAELDEVAAKAWDEGRQWLAEQAGDVTTYEDPNPYRTEERKGPDAGH